MQFAGVFNAVGPRFDDVANTIRLGGYTTVDFNTAIALSKSFTLQLKLGNAFNRQYETAQYYNQQGRSAYITLRYQPTSK